MLDTLVVYGSHFAPQRASVADHLLAFKRHPSCRCVYVNAFYRKVPEWAANSASLIVFHTSFLSSRWRPAQFRRIWANVATTLRSKALKVAIPQDEFINTDILCEFLSEFKVGLVLTCAEESEWSKIYGQASLSGLRLRTVLTGYIDDASLARAGRIVDSAGGRRSIDIGYRAWRAEAWLGRHGILKTQIASVFEEAGASRGLSCDISLEPKDTLLGDAWLRFLASCKCTIGVEGGASILDSDGSIRTRVAAFTRENPGASFDEVEAACFKGLDGGLSLFALSPRHLEACATRTCQILVEGRYNGVLNPDEHYIPVKKDFSDVSEALDKAMDPQLRERIVSNAYRDVAASGKYSYRAMVEELLSLASEGRELRASKGFPFFQRASSSIIEKAIKLFVNYPLGFALKVVQAAPPGTKALFERAWNSFVSRGKAKGGTLKQS